MAYFYSFELILVGIILLSVMGFAGIRLLIKRKQEKSEMTKTHLDETETSDTTPEDIS